MPKTNDEYNSSVAISEIGAMWFVFDETVHAFKYIAPLREKGDFSKDADSLECTELDSKTSQNITGRIKLSSPEYKTNFDLKRYQAVEAAVDNIKAHTYLEVLSGGFGMIYIATGVFGNTNDDPIQIDIKLNLQSECVVYNVNSLTADDVTNLAIYCPGATLTASSPLPFNADSIPTGRVSGVTES